MALASELKKGSYFIHGGEPVRVNRKEVVVYGTHSHSKLKLYVQGLNTKNEKAVNLHHNDKIEIIDVIRKAGQVLSKTDENIQIMDLVSYETLDSSAPDELMNELNAGDEITFVNIKGDVKILDKRQ